MPNDYITLRALAAELDERLRGGKIDKIQMPEKDEIALLVRAAGQNHRLAISCNANNPRIHLTQIKKPSAQVAPAFCMHLRKHLANGAIERISLLGNDRIVGIEISARNELHDVVRFTLTAEMMGRYSNILVVNERGIITDSLKQVSYDTATKRCLLPSARYELPAQGKILLQDPDAIRACLTRYDGTETLLAYVIKHFAGLSNATAAQLLCDAGVRDARALSDDRIDAILQAIESMLNCYGSERFAPCVQMSDGCAIDYYMYPYQGVETTPAPSLNDAIERCVSEKDLRQRRDERTRYLQKAYNALLNKTQKKLDKCLERYAQSQNQDEYRILGELITANLHRIRKGDTRITVADYYRPDCPDRVIQLDERLTPQQNAQAYFKKYAKLKRTEAVVVEQIEQTRDFLQYLQTIAPSIAMCSTPQEIAEVQAELESVGALRVRKQDKSTKIKPAQPLLYEYEDFAICVGKNNYQNEKLTFKLANGNDLWVHTKDAHSSHVIVFAEGRDIPESVIRTACEICAYYSHAADGGKIACDYTLRKNLRRHPIGKPGMVLYTTYRTAVVSPNRHETYLVRE